VTHDRDADGHDQGVLPEPAQGSRLSGDQSTARQAERTLPPRDGRDAGMLVVVRSPDGDAPGASFRLPADGMFLVGRGVQQSGVALADDHMSRLHFRIAWDGRQSAFRLGDARSKNGTYVNGVRAVSAALRSGDVIRAGDSLFVYQEGNAMEEVSRRAERAAPTDLTLLLLGETGCGKEVLAHAVHEKSGRSGPFIPVNCAAIPKTLIDTELFGHTRGAFSGAVQARIGLFAAADGGTLLLDEVADLPMEVQPVLLRALEAHAIRPIGAEREIAIRTRVIAATHVDLEAARAAGRFRDDLFARLAQVVLRIPPLRERRTEVLRLARAFGALELSPSAAEALLIWHWPHNVRELRALVESFMTLEESGTELGLEHLAETNPAMVAAFTEPRNDEAPVNKSLGPSIGRSQLQALLVKHEGNVSAVAKELGKVRAQVYRWIKSYGLSTR
jgi:transcriptional regulator of acetoin/glycerol metabolism